MIQIGAPDLILVPPLENDFRPEFGDIVALDRIPRNIGCVLAGVIVSKLQAPHEVFPELPGKHQIDFIAIVVAVIHRYKLMVYGGELKTIEGEAD